jgi:hypothetical protein
MAPENSRARSRFGHAVLSAMRARTIVKVEAAMPDTRCSSCDKTEIECKCDRYCCYCQGQEHIRLAADGQYYCPDCREACEVPLATGGAS